MKKQQLAILLVPYKERYHVAAAKMMCDLSEMGFSVLPYYFCLHPSQTKVPLLQEIPSITDVNINDYVVSEDDETSDSKSRKSLFVNFYLPACYFDEKDLPKLYKDLDTVFINTENGMERFITHTEITHRVYLLH